MNQILDSVNCNKSICGICGLTDGLVYTSNPPQVRCTITGEFHYCDEVCSLNYKESNEVKDD